MRNNIPKDFQITGKHGILILSKWNKYILIANE